MKILAIAFVVIYGIITLYGMAMPKETGTPGAQALGGVIGFLLFAGYTWAIYFLTLTFGS